MPCPAQSALVAQEKVSHSLELSGAACVHACCTVSFSRDQSLLEYRCMAKQSPRMSFETVDAHSFRTE